MNEKTAKDAVQGKPSRVWNTNGKPNQPLSKTWSGSGKVIRNDKGGKNGK
jgi:hypothetical protein